MKHSLVPSGAASNHQQPYNNHNYGPFSANSHHGSSSIHPKDLATAAYSQQQSYNALLLNHHYAQQLQQQAALQRSPESVLTNNTKNSHETSAPNGGNGSRMGIGPHDPYKFDGGSTGPPTPTATSYLGGGHPYRAPASVHTITTKQPAPPFDPRTLVAAYNAGLSDPKSGPAQLPQLNGFAAKYMQEMELARRLQLTAPWEGELGSNDSSFDRFAQTTAAFRSVKNSIGETTKGKPLDNAADRKTLHDDYLQAISMLRSDPMAYSQKKLCNSSPHPFTKGMAVSHTVNSTKALSNRQSPKPLLPTDRIRELSDEAAYHKSALNIKNSLIESNFPAAPTPNTNPYLTGQLPTGYPLPFQIPPGLPMIPTPYNFDPELLKKYSQQLSYMNNGGINNGISGEPASPYPGGGGTPFSSHVLPNPANAFFGAHPPSLLPDAIPKRPLPISNGGLPQNPSGARSSTGHDESELDHNHHIAATANPLAMAAVNQQQQAVLMAAAAYAHQMRQLQHLHAAAALQPSPALYYPQHPQAAAAAYLAALHGANPYALPHHPSPYYLPHPNNNNNGYPSPGTTTTPSPYDFLPPPHPSFPFATAGISSFFLPGGPNLLNPQQLASPFVNAPPLPSPHLYTTGDGDVQPERRSTVNEGADGKVVAGRQCLSRNFAYHHDTSNARSRPTSPVMTNPVPSLKRKPSPAPPLTSLPAKQSRLNSGGCEAQTVDEQSLGGLRASTRHNSVSGRPFSSAHSFTPPTSNPGRRCLGKVAAPVPSMFDHESMSSAKVVSIHGNPNAINYSHANATPTSTTNLSNSLAPHPFFAIPPFAPPLFSSTLNPMMAQMFHPSPFVTKNMINSHQDAIKGSSHGNFGVASPLQPPNSIITTKNNNIIDRHAQTPLTPPAGSGSHASRHSLGGHPPSGFVSPINNHHQQEWQQHIFNLQHGITNNSATKSSPMAHLNNHFNSPIQHQGNSSLHNTSIPGNNINTGKLQYITNGIPVNNKTGTGQHHPNQSHQTLDLTNDKYAVVKNTTWHLPTPSSHCAAPKSGPHQLSIAKSSKADHNSEISNITPTLVSNAYKGPTNNHQLPFSPPSIIHNNKGADVRHTHVVGNYTGPVSAPFPPSNCNNSSGNRFSVAKNSIIEEIQRLDSCLDILENRMVMMNRAKMEMTGELNARLSNGSCINALSNGRLGQHRQHSNSSLHSSSLTTAADASTTLNTAASIIATTNHGSSPVMSHKLTLSTLQSRMIEARCRLAQSNGQGIRDHVISANRSSAEKSHKRVARNFQQMMMAPSNRRDSNNTATARILEQLNAVDALKSRHSLVSKTLGARISRQRRLDALKYARFDQEYRERLEAWNESVTKSRKIAKRRNKDAKAREFFENQFSELRDDRLERERLRRVWTRNTVGNYARTETDVEEITKRLLEQEEERKRLHNLSAPIPHLRSTTDKEHESRTVFLDPLRILPTIRHFSFTCPRYMNFPTPQTTFAASNQDTYHDKDHNNINDFSLTDQTLVDKVSLEPEPINYQVEGPIVSSPDRKEINEPLVVEKCCPLADTCDFSILLPLELRSIMVIHYNPWSEEEHEIFKRSYASRPKEFDFIARALPNKTIQECVLHYYRTKKEENYKKMVARRKMANKKRKYNNSNNNNNNSNSTSSLNNNMNNPNNNNNAFGSKELPASMHLIVTTKNSALNASSNTAPLSTTGRSFPTTLHEGADKSNLTLSPLKISTFTTIEVTDCGNITEVSTLEPASTNQLAIIAASNVESHVTLQSGHQQFITTSIPILSATNNLEAPPSLPVIATTSSNPMETNLIAKTSNLLLDNQIGPFKPQFDSESTTFPTIKQCANLPPINDCDLAVPKPHEPPDFVDFVANKSPVTNSIAPSNTGCKKEQQSLSLTKSTSSPPLKPFKVSESTKRATMVHDPYEFEPSTPKGSDHHRIINSFSISTKSHVSLHGPSPSTKTPLPNDTSSHATKTNYHSKVGHSSHNGVLFTTSKPELLNNVKVSSTIVQRPKDDYFFGPFNNIKAVPSSSSITTLPPPLPAGTKSLLPISFSTHIMPHKINVTPINSNNFSILGPKRNSGPSLLPPASVILTGSSPKSAGPHPRTLSFFNRSTPVSALSLSLTASSPVTANTLITTPSSTSSVSGLSTKSSPLDGTSHLIINSPTLSLGNCNFDNSNDTLTLTSITTGTPTITIRANNSHRPSCTEEPPEKRLRLTESAQTLSSHSQPIPDLSLNKNLSNGTPTTVMTNLAIQAFLSTLPKDGPPLSTIPFTTGNSLQPTTVASSFGGTPNIGIITDDLTPSSSVTGVIPSPRKNTAPTPLPFFDASHIIKNGGGGHHSDQLSTPSDHVDTFVQHPKAPINTVHVINDGTVVAGSPFAGNDDSLMMNEMSGDALLGAVIAHQINQTVSNAESIELWNPLKHSTTNSSSSQNQ